MNVLPREKRLAILAALVEGNSERAIERLCDVNRETVGRLALAFGEGAQRLQDRLARDLACTQVVADELFAFVGVKASRVRPDHPEGSGEAYVFSAMCKTSRFIITWHVGRRDQASTDLFVRDLRARLTVMPSIVTDGFAPYVSAVGAEFGPSVDYAQTVKNYRSGGRRDDDHRYEPPRDPFVTKKPVYGAPDLDAASTAYIERNNGTMRHRIGRMRRLVLAFSKRLPNLRAACALNYAFYNLCFIVKTLRITPAMALGIADHVWSIDEFYDAVTDEAPVAKPTAKPLTHRAPPAEQPARALPAGRGWLRLLQGGGETPKGPTPGPEPVAPAASLPALREVPRRWEQLSLFGDIVGEKGTDENRPE